MDSTTSIAVANNQIAVTKAENIFNREKVKAAMAKLASFGSAGFQMFLDKSHALNSMKDDEVRDEVHSAFASAKEQFETEIYVLNNMPSFSRGFDSKSVEEAVSTFMEIEKEILDIKDMPVLRKVALMFWTGVKFIVGFILKSAIKAAKFIATCGIRFIAAGIDFIIKIVQETVKFVKRVVAAVRVAIDGREEIIDVEARECE